MGANDKQLHPEFRTVFVFFCKFLRGIKHKIDFLRFFSSKGPPFDFSELKNVTLKNLGNLQKKEKLF